MFDQCSIWEHIYISKKEGEIKMKEYTVAPNKDATGWYVKVEDIAPTDHYEKKDKAIAKAEEMAQENKPSKLYILDKYHEVLEEKSY